MLTLLLLLLPSLGALAALATKGTSARQVALLTSLVQLGITLFCLATYQSNTSLFAFDASWVASLGIHFKLNMDGISLIMVLLTNLLMPFIVVSGSALDDIDAPRMPARYALMLFMQTALIGVFTAIDGFLFYVFWELALIPIWFISLIWGSENRRTITLKFFMYTLLGSLFMLIGLIYLYLQTPAPHTFDLQAFYNLSLSASAQSWVFWAFFIAFAIKMPVFPFHTWQPDTYVSAPTQGTMLLSGIMLKMGVYGLIRWLLPVAPQGVQAWMNFAMVLAVIGIVYAAIIAIQQRDVKRLIAYSSMSHVGLIAAGVLAMNYAGLQGSIIQMLSHGINVVALFYVVDLLQRKTHTRNLDELGGIANIDREFAILFFIIVAGSVALPLTNGFVGEFMLLNGVFQANAVLAGIAGLSIIFGAVYMLRVYRSTMFGETNDLSKHIAFVGSAEKWVLIPLCILIIALGIYPKPLLDIAQPAIEQLLVVIGG